MSAIDRAYRAEFGRAVATLARLTGDLELAEDAVQEAFAEALRTWPERGTPDNPAAWITTAARNRARDVLRREASRSGKEADFSRHATWWEEPDVSPVADDQLRMIFLCCHPALSPESQVALTLRLVCGLRTAEIARAFMQPEHTVAVRISRAKSKIRQARIPLQIPPERMTERMPVVLACIYLVFSEGYFATSGPLAVRDDLCDEAIRLGRLLCGLMPDPEANSLLALMLLHDSRRAQRRSGDGSLVPLEEQDRTRWDRGKIEAGLHLIEGSGSYAHQACIAALHATARSWEDTDWDAITRHYDALPQNPAVLLNRAIALGFRDGFDAGIEALSDPQLAELPNVHAARADLLRRAGRFGKAAGEYEKAIETTTNEQVRAFLKRRLRELRD